MFQRVYSFNVDFMTAFSISPMTFIRDDTNVNIMNITLVSNGIPIDITGCTVELRFKKSDKTTVLGMAEIVNALTGNIKYKLGTNEIASIGNVLVGIMIYGQNGERASSYPFRFSVIADMDDQYDAISSTEYPILTQLISETTEIRNDYLELMNGGGGTDHIHLNMDVLNGLEDDGTGTGILYNGNPIQGSTTTGEDGESAYEIAVRNGFSGTEVEWLASLKGDKGDTGIQGIMPSHQWSGTSLQFQNPDGSWGSLVDLKGQDGTGGSIPSNIILFEDWVIGELVEIDTSGTPDTTAPTVTISPIAGIYGSARTVTMTANESATIYYTLDGSTPTISSTVYSSPLTISSTTTIRYFGRDTAGNSSVVQSATYTIDTVSPNNVTNLVTSNITANSLTLSWTASTSSDVSSYDIYNGETLLGNTASITYNVSGLTANTSYTFSVRAKDSIGNTASGTTVNATTSSVIDTTAPNNVTNLTASNVTQTGLTLNWTASTSSDVASYDVYNGNTLLGNTSLTTYDISSLTAGTQYTFNVKAKDVSGNVATGISVTITTSASNPSVAYVTQNLVAGYDMAQGTGTTCNDLSGNNNTLTLVGTDGTTGGFIGGVLRLDGQNDAGEIIDSNSFAFGSNDFTIQMKFRLNVAQTTQILFSQSGADSGADANTSVTCYMSGDTITFRTVVNSTRYQFATTATLTDTASYHNIAMVRSGNTLYGYLDQVQVGSIALASGGTVNNSTKKFAIGRWGEDPSLYLNGLVRAFLVYNGKALTIAEMSQNDIAFAV